MRPTKPEPTGRYGSPATLASRLVLGGLAVALLVLSCFFGIGLAGWSVGATVLQRLQGAAFVLLVSVVLGAGGVAVAREVAGRSAFSPWLLAGTLPAAVQVLVFVFD